MSRSLLLFVTLGVLAHAANAQDTVQTDRYTQVSLAPSPAQQDPLQVVINTRIPQHITTVGGAIDYLLARSGYRLAAPENRDPKAEMLYQFPLPEVHRELGPIRLEAALQLLGQDFVLVRDPINRLVAFDAPKPAQSRGR